MQSIQLNEGSKWGNFPFTNQPINQKIILTVAAIALTTCATSYYFSADQGLLASRVQQALPSGSSLAVIAFCGVLCWANYLYSAKCLADAAATNDERFANLRHRIDDLTRQIRGLSGGGAEVGGAEVVESSPPAPIRQSAPAVAPVVRQPDLVEVPPPEILAQQFRALRKKVDPAVYVTGLEAHNRYPDVLPFRETWYGNGVNANRIFHGTEEVAIATQGPLGNDVGFWGMVFNSDTTVVVSLGNHSNGTKFHPFWGDKEVGAFKIAVSGVSRIGDSDFTCVTSNITIQEGEKKKQITHFYFMDWPDMSVVKPEHLGKFVEMIAAGEYKLPVVHCSAGIGRTGVFLAVYIAYLQNRKNSGSNQPALTIEDTVRALRDPNTGRTEDMVQTLKQYELAWEASIWLSSQGLRSNNSSDAVVEPPAPSCRSR